VIGDLAFHQSPFPEQFLGEGQQRKVAGELDPEQGKSLRLQGS
jgi:hypothetical protein